MNPLDAIPAGGGLAAGIVVGGGIAIGIAALAACRALRLGAGLAYAGTAFAAAAARGALPAPARDAALDGASPALLDGAGASLAVPLVAVATAIAAPLLHRGGRELGAALRGAPGVPAAALAGARGAARLFLLGGLTYVAGGFRAAEGGDAAPAMRLAFLLAAVWSLCDPAAAGAAGDTVDGRRRLAGPSASILAWLAIIALSPWPADLDGSAGGAIDAGRAGAALGASAAAAAIGALVAALVSLGGASRATTPLADIAGSLAAAGVAVAISGSAPLAAFLCGLFGDLLARREDAPAGAAGLGARIETALEPVLGASIATAVGLTQPGILDASGWIPAALLWAAALGVDALVRSASRLGDVVGSRSRPPAETAAPRAAAAGVHPGLIALAALLALAPANAAGDPAPGAALCARAILLALALQGGLAPAIRGRRGVLPGSPDPLELAWERLDGRAIALRALRDSLARARAEGLLDEVGAEALERSIDNEDRRVRLAQDDAVAESPRLREIRWARARAALLEQAARALDEACRDGRIGEHVAARLRADLARRISRTDLAAVDGLFEASDRPAGAADEAPDAPRAPG